MALRARRRLLTQPGVHEVSKEKALNSDFGPNMSKWNFWPSLHPHPRLNGPIILPGALAETSESFLVLFSHRPTLHPSPCLAQALGSPP